MFGQYKVSPAEDNLNLGCGQPGNEYIHRAWELFNENSKIDLNFYEVMQYGKKDGHQLFKESIISTYFKECSSVKPDNIFMTGGVSQGIQMITGLYRNQQVNQPMTIYVEELTYFIMLNHFRDYNFNIKTFNLQNLDEFKEQLDRSGDEMAMVYLIPFCSNPTGKTITKEQLEEFISIVDKYNLMVLSDETYYAMQKSDITPLYLYSSKIISFHTFSKIFAPGVRTGWLMTLNDQIIHKLNDSGFIDSGGSVNPVQGLIMSQVIETAEYYHFLQRMLLSLESKRDLICQVLDSYPNTFSYVKPDGGYFIFVKLNDKYKIDSNRFLEICKSHGVTFHQGWKFTTNELKDKYKNYFRLSCSYYYYGELLDRFASRFESIVTELERKIWVLGATGRLGSLICEELNSRSLKYKTIMRDFNLDNLTNNDLIVDVSSPEGIKTLLEKLVSIKTYPKIIIGTTGQLPQQLINEYPGEIIVRSNFSEGVPLVLSFLDLLDKNIWKTITIKDFHHKNKKDSPSGTAKTITKRLESNGLHDIKIESYREGDIIGIHEIEISNDVESITIKHEAKDRKIFAIGCVNLICKMIGI
jgi:DNA-binding transcriptional MocR family regulator/dihydrodipicolinate reductase